MANGSFYKYVAGNNDSNYFGLYCEYTYDQNINENYTNVTVDVYIRYYSLNVTAVSDCVTVTVGSASKTFGSPAINKGGGGNKTKLGSAVFKVQHNDDGAKTNIGLSAKWNIGITYSDVYYATLSASTTVNLPTIPRASIINSVSCATSYFDGQITYKYTPQSSIYYNRCNISLNIDGTFTEIKTINLGTKSAAQQTATVTLSATELSKIYNALPKKTKGILRFTLRTYSDSGYSTQVGSTSYKEITLNIPTSVKPKIGTITLDPVNITTKDGTSRNILVKSKNKIKVSVSGSEAGAGSSINFYTFTVLKGSTTIDTITTTSTSATFGPFSQTGDLSFRISISDNRGRTTNNNGSEPSWTCYSYDAPYFSAFDIFRANSDGSSNMNGAYIKCTYTPTFSSVDSTNSVTVTAYYNGKSKTCSDGSVLIDLDGDTSTTYQVYLTIADNYNGSNKTSLVNIFGQTRVLNITSDGTGVALGKMAESNNLFESRWPAKFDSECEVNGKLTVGTSTQSVTPTAGITVHDVRDATITPDSFGDKNANFYFDQIDSRWMGIIHMKGWTGSYAAWELAGNAHNSSSDNTLKYRQGVGDTWGDWQTVITNKNINNYVDQGSYLPLSGGTLTGKLTLDGNAYYASGNTAGLDCQNSDIINANGIYFRDASDSAGESINFYRSDTTWDTLYAADGKLKFHPNRATSTTLGGYTVYNSSNFRRGTCTLSSSSDTQINFTSAMGGTPTVILTPLTETAGVIPGKVKSASSTGFTAIIGGSAVSSAKFAYLAIYY